MNMYITELASLIPMCSAMNRKLDRLTVLRMAVQHMKTLPGSGRSCPEPSLKPPFFSDDEYKHMILKAADGFLFVVSCDRGRILYVSTSVSTSLNYSQSDLMGQSLFDFLHPKDIQMVKDHLSSSDLARRDRFIDPKTMQPVKTEMANNLSQFVPGARRSFYCRMKTGSKSEKVPDVKIEKGAVMDSVRRRRIEKKNYAVIHCTGYVKSWPQSKMNMVEENEEGGESCNLSCLVVVGRLQTPFTPKKIQEHHHTSDVNPLEFISRQTVDGKFTYVDQRMTPILGYLPQELVGTSIYEYYHVDDIQQLVDTHKLILQSKVRVTSPVYRFKAKDSSFIFMKTTAYAFQNPWTKEVESVVATNTVTQASEYNGQEVSSSGVSADLDVFSTDDETKRKEYGGVNLSMMQSSTCTYPGAGKIGRQIADEVLECQNPPAEPAYMNMIHAEELANELIRAQCLMGSDMPREGTSHDLPPASLQSTIDLHTTTIASPTGSAAVLDEESMMRQLSPHMPPREALIPPNGGHVGTHSADMGGDYDDNLMMNQMPSDRMVQVPGNGLIPRNGALEHDGMNWDNQGAIDGVIEPNAMLGIPEHSSENNDEATMSILMSLLEADAGLGGPVDFSDLPWPL
ncbi:basic helix-loop-helix ARNT-like protein 1 isoform X2 [Lineus longissimus]